MSRARAGSFRAYLEESRGVGPSVALVLPLLLVYELAMLVVQSPVRNGAEVVVGRLFTHLPVDTLRRLVVAALVVGVLAVWHRRHFAVEGAGWLLLEALALALVLGPLVAWMVGGVGLSAPALIQADPLVRVLLSVGAGVWEEIVFRLALLGGLAFVLVRLLRLPVAAGLGIAVVASALLFALYHHVGVLGEPLSPDRLVFRTVAGTILGVLFVVRGLAVVVYMHVFYDVLCDLRVLLA